MPYFDDDGNELNPDLVPKPALCVACRNDEADDEMEVVLCNLTRLDQEVGREFVCHAFVPKTPG
jgi:hypothetical protein